jgi:hypothetical protein
MSDDAITDQSLTVLECRVLFELLSERKRVSAFEPIPYDGSLVLLRPKILANLTMKAQRGAKMETPKETIAREKLDE